MPSFQQLFAATQGEPIEYQTRTLILVDRFPVPKSTNLKLTFESIGSDWKQGVILKADGEFIVAGRTIRNQVIFWYHTAPKEITLSLKSQQGYVEVYNAWDTGDGCVHSWHNGAAMWTEKIEKGRRFHCNDGHPDDDFDDIVFCIERMG
jgi:hypothetical protein